MKKNENASCQLHWGAFGMEVQKLAFGFVVKRWIFFGRIKWNEFKLLKPKEV